MYICGGMPKIGEEVECRHDNYLVWSIQISLLSANLQFFPQNRFFLSFCSSALLIVYFLFDIMLNFLVNFLLSNTQPKERKDWFSRYFTLFVFIHMVFFLFLLFSLCFSIFKKHRVLGRVLSVFVDNELLLLYLPIAIWNGSTRIGCCLCDTSFSSAVSVLPLTCYARSV